jgi:hypothetical protein
MVNIPRASNPTSSFGYYRGAPLAGGDGAGEGQSMAGLGKFAQGQGSTDAGGSTGWHPTVIYLGALIIAEMALFAFISRHI